MRSRRMMVWTSCVTVTPWRRGEAAQPRPCRGSSLLLPSRLRVHDRVARGGVVGGDDLLVAVLPLSEQERLLGRAGVVPAERPQDRVDRVRVQPVGERLLIVD